MTDHLPECSCSDAENFESWNVETCICDRLRACEQRVEETWSAIAGRDQYAEGYTAAVDAARKAIAALPKEDGGYCHVLHACDVDDAIDALREKP